MSKPPVGIVQKFVNLMIKIDESGLLYSSLIDRNFEILINLGVDLKPFLRSKLVLHTISNTEYLE